MPRKPTQQQVFDALLTQYEGAIADAFRAAVNDLTSAADLQGAITALEAGNVQAALDALHLDPAAYGPLQDAIQASYVAGGTSGAGFANSQTPSDVVIRFNARNYRAEAWLREHSSTLITRIVEDQRNAIRQALTAGMERGVNPRTSALDIVGRVNRATGQRESGIIGLTAQQEQFARNARDELASGDPAQLRNYLTRGRIDKRFNRTVERAILEGRPVPAETIGKAVVRYRAGLLQLRGETIGLTEGLTSLQAAKLEAFRQAVESGAIQASAVKKKWRDAGDLRVRHSHMIMDGQTVGLEEPFRTPTGARLMHPGDTSLGAPASEIIRCRCDVQYSISFLDGIR